MAREYDVYVLPGQTVGSFFQWKNNGVIGFQPRFRLAIKHGGGWDDKGDWIDAPLLAPGAESPYDPGNPEGAGALRATVKIPDSWGGGTVIDVGLFAEVPGYFGETLAWHVEDFLEIPAIQAEWIEITRAAVYNE